MKSQNGRRLQRRYSIAAKCVLLLLLSQFVGCGSDQLPVYPVDGTVRFEDGSKVMFGNVEFYNAEHRLNARGTINRDGTFEVGTFTENDGAVAGKHKVIIVQVTGNYLTEKLSDDIQHEHGDLISSAYFDYRTSGLECEIEPGRNPVDFVVKKNPRQTEDGLPKN